MKNMCSFKRINLSSVLNSCPFCFAKIKGSSDYSNINGVVRFYQTTSGVVVFWEIFGLPNLSEIVRNGVFAFHIHSGDECSGNASDPFANALTHYNPTNQPHPYHAGDLPPLFSNDGYSFGAVLTNRFSASEIVGKTIVIHSGVDDFTTQPAGASGVKIACGEIKRY